MNPTLAKLAGLSTGKAFVIGAVVTLIYYSMFYDDGARIRANMATVGKELETERAKETETDRALARKKQLKDSYEALTEQFKAVSAQIPSDLDSAVVIRTVDTMAKTSGIMIKSKEPKPAVRQDILEMYPIRVVADGTYSEMTSFFFSLSTLKRVFRVKSFTFEATDDRKSGSRKMAMDAEITSFKFVGAEAAEPQTPGPAGRAKTPAKRKSK